jgi:hypothetical protein
MMNPMLTMALKVMTLGTLMARKQKIEDKFEG